MTITVDGREVAVKGPKGEITLNVASPIEVAVEDNQVVVSRPDDERESRSLHGLTRTLINNNIIGVTQGYSKGLEVVGTGYRVQQKGSSVEFALDKQAVGEAAANIRKIRKPEPYKGKGVRYAGEVVRRKAGKAGK